MGGYKLIYQQRANFRKKHKKEIEWQIEHNKICVGFDLVLSRKKCVICGKYFVFDVKKINRVICSKKCRHKYCYTRHNKRRSDRSFLKWQKTYISCVFCGKKFRPNRKSPQKTTCSEDCFKNKRIYKSYKIKYPTTYKEMLLLREAKHQLKEFREAVNE